MDYGDVTVERKRLEKEGETPRSELNKLVRSRCSLKLQNRARNSNNSEARRRPRKSKNQISFFKQCELVECFKTFMAISLVAEFFPTSNLNEMEVIALEQ